MPAPADRRPGDPAPSPPGLSFHRRLLFLGIGVVPAILALALILALKGRGSDGPEATPTDPSLDPSTRTPRPESGRRPTRRTPAAREDAAKRLYDAAVALERSNPNQGEGLIDRYREVYVKYPGTLWAKLAEEKVREADERSRRIREKEFQVIVKNARSQAAAGRVIEAIESLKGYIAEKPDDPYRRRASVEVLALENESRAAFNEAAAAAEKLAGDGKYADAAALFEALEKGAIAEVAARCDAALAELREAIRQQAESAEAGKVDAAHEAFRKEEAPRILDLLRARRYADALQALDGAAKKPEYAGIKESVAAERNAMATASAFWRAFRQALQSRLNRSVSILLTDGKSVAGTLSRIEPDRVFVRTGDLFTTVGLDRIHPDLLVAWTVGPVLPAERPDTDLKAGLFFFCDGRDGLARLYLATALEKGATLDAIDPVFRRGYLRAARHAAGKTKPEEPVEEGEKKKGEKED